jgi:uncharacterized protein YceK
MPEEGTQGCRIMGMKNACILALARTLPLVICGGCTSLVVHTHADFFGNKPPVYMGTTCDALLIAYPGAMFVHAEVPAAISISYGIIDLPPSVAMDTLLIPIDLIRATNQRTNRTQKAETAR